MSVLISENARWLDTPDGTVVLNLSTGRCYHLTPTASAAWKHLVDQAGSLPRYRTSEEGGELLQAENDRKQANFIQYFQVRGLLLEKMNPGLRQ